MLEQLFRDAVVYTLGRAVSALSGLLLLPLYTAYLSPEQYGLWDIGYLVVSLATLLVAFEVSQGAARHYCGTTDRGDRGAYFSTALLFTLVAFAVFVTVASVLAPWLVHPVLGPGADSSTMVLVVVAAASTAIFRLALAQLRWMLRPWAFLAASLLQVGITAAISISLVIHGFGAEGMFWGLLGGNLVGLVLALGFGRAQLSLEWSSPHLRRMLRFSIPLVASSAAVFVANYIDRIAIKEILSMTEVGIYAVAYRFAAAIDLVLAGFSAALMPLIYTHHADPKTPGHLAALFRRMVFVGMLVVVGLAAFSRDLIELFASEDYQEAAGLVAVLAATVFVVKLQGVAPGLWISERTRVIAAINIGSAGMNLGLNIALIPHFGVHGAAFATLSSALVAFVANMYWSHRSYPVAHQWLRLLLGTALCGAAVSAVWFGTRGLAQLSIAGIAIKLGLLLAAGAILGAAVLKRGDVQAFKNIVRRAASA